MNKIKIIFILITTFTFCFLLKTQVYAVEEPSITITNVQAEERNNTIKFSISSKVNITPTSYGIILSKTNEALTLENKDAYIYSFKQTYKEFFSISIRMPKYAYYQKLYAVAYVILGEEVIYSNKVCSSFAVLANLDKVVFKDILYTNNSITFIMSSSIDLGAEYGLIFSKNQLIPNLTLENAKTDQFETLIVKLEALNENNEYKVTITNIPETHQNITFKACAYVELQETKETYLTETIEVNIQKNNDSNLTNN